MKYYRSIKYIFVFLYLCIALNLNAQNDAYYSTINPTLASFITDLKNRIRSPYIRIAYDSYDENIVANYESYTHSSSQRAVRCVYSNYLRIYTPPFAWNGSTTEENFGREHTWCFSWMPSNPPEASDEYADHHHLFPTEQPYVNSIRGNYPLGIVVGTPTYVFGEGKRGYNASSSPWYLVYEPRNNHKGDAARALLYMSIRYDRADANNYDWTFNTLNSTKLPTNNQSVELLLQWHKQDPPDKWEIDRNNFIEYNQLNRNPFVDHPEYVNYINFNDLSLIAPAPSYFTEPANYPTGLNYSINGNSIIINWTVATGTLSGYLVEIYNSDNYFIPIDGEIYTDDNDLSDGKGLLNITDPSASCTFYNYSSLAKYYFRIYTYNGSGSLRNYKVDGKTVPLASTYTSPVASINLLDNFNRSDAFTNDLGSTPTSPSPLTWLKNGTTSTSIGIISNSLRLGSTTSGRELAYLDMTSVSGYPLILKNAVGKLTWAFNMRQTNADPNGFENGQTGLSFILCGTSSNIAASNSTDAGYAISFGQPSPTNTNYIRLISFNNGLNNNSDLKIANIIKSELGDYGNKYFSIKVTFDPEFENWELFVESNSSSFPQANPLNTSNKIGNTSISSGYTSKSMPIIGCFWNHGTTTDYAYFDDIYIPDPQGVLPVKLTVLNSNVIERNVKLNWTTSSELNNKGFDVERINNEELKINKWQSIGFVEGQGTKNAPTRYSFEDKNLNTGKYKYRLKQIDHNGNYEYFELNGEVEIGVPKKYDLSQNYPNPFNPTTKINFDLPVDSRVSILIYDVTGREVARVINNEFKKAGYYTTEFNVGSLSSGVYFYSLSAENFRAAKKMVVLK